MDIGLGVKLLGQLGSPLGSDMICQTSVYHRETRSDIKL